MIRTFNSSRDSLKTYVVSVAATILAVSLCAPTGSSQSLQNHRPPAGRLLVGPHTQLVLIETSVLDKHGDFVNDLTQTSFRVLDDGVEQPIAFFAPVEEPAQVLVMLETSPAVYLIHDEHLAAAYALVEGLAQDDEVSLVTYDRTPQTVLSFTSEKGALLAALGRTQYTLGMGDLNLYDSISTVLDWMAPITGKKAIVLIATGLDSSSASHWDDLAQKLRGRDVVIFPVALGGALRDGPLKPSKRKKLAVKGDTTEGHAAGGSKGMSAFARADNALRSLAKMTGGLAYFPATDQDFAAIYHEIASALRHQYVLGIAPADDNQFHTLAVEVLDGPAHAGGKSTKKPEYQVFARTGYLAPGR